MLMFSLSERQIERLIYLKGKPSHPSGYTIVMSGFDGCPDLMVKTSLIGRTIVQALRELARERPDLFPGHG